MLPRRYKWPRAVGLPATLVPPNLDDFGQITFTSDDYNRLREWLSEEGWPKDHMNIDTLEGYLVAMIVWPVELPPGAWFPAIWGIRGWKVAEKISSPEAYLRFSRLVVGYRQHLAFIVSSKPQTYVPELGGKNEHFSESVAAMHWSVGFFLALQSGAQGFNSPSPEVTSAVRLIAGHAQPTLLPLPKKRESAARELGAAVCAIALERAMTRGTAVPKPRREAPLH